MKKLKTLSLHFFIIYLLGFASVNSFALDKYQTALYDKYNYGCVDDDLNCKLNALNTLIASLNDEEAKIYLDELNFDKAYTLGGIYKEYSKERILKSNKIMLEIIKKFQGKKEKHWSYDYTLVNIAWKYYADPTLQNFEKAKKYHNLAIKEAEPHTKSYALNNMGSLYAQGYAYKEDLQKAYSYYKKAADLDNPYGLSNLADYYIFGDPPVEPNFDVAIRYIKYSLIADREDDDFVKLNVLLNKKRLPKNKEEFLHWLENYTIENKDAHGFSHMSYILEDLSEDFKNIEKVKECLMWKMLGYKLVNNMDRRMQLLGSINTLKKKLTNDQIIEVKNKSENWIKKNWIN